MVLTGQMSMSLVAVLLYLSNVFFPYVTADEAQEAPTAQLYTVLSQTTLMSEKLWDEADLYAHSLSKRSILKVLLIYLNVEHIQYFLIRVQRDTLDIEIQVLKIITVFSCIFSI